MNLLYDPNQKALTIVSPPVTFFVKSFEANMPSMGLGLLSAFATLAMVFQIPLPSFFVRPTKASVALA